MPRLPIFAVVLALLWSLCSLAESPGGHAFEQDTGHPIVDETLQALRRVAVDQGYTLFSSYTMWDEGLGKHNQELLDKRKLGPVDAGVARIEIKEELDKITDGIGQISCQLSELRKEMRSELLKRGKDAEQQWLLLGIQRENEIEKLVEEKMAVIGKLTDKKTAVHEIEDLSKLLAVQDMLATKQDRARGAYFGDKGRLYLRLARQRLGLEAMKYGGEIKPGAFESHIMDKANRVSGWLPLLLQIDQEFPEPKPIQSFDPYQH